MWLRDACTGTGANCGQHNHWGSNCFSWPFPCEKTLHDLTWLWRIANYTWLNRVNLTEQVKWLSRVRLLSKHGNHGLCLRTSHLLSVSDSLNPRDTAHFCPTSQQVRWIIPQISIIPIPILYLSGPFPYLSCLSIYLSIISPSLQFLLFLSMSYVCLFLPLPSLSLHVSVCVSSLHLSPLCLFN